MSTLTLTPEEASPLSHKEVGEECVVKLTLTVTKNDESGFSGTISGVEPEEGYGDESEEDETYEEEEPARDEGKHPKGKPALMLVVGSKK